MKTKFVKTLLSISVSFMIASCIGDRKQVDLKELEDSSFINKKFKGNLIDYQEGMSACSGLNASEIAQLYGVSTEMVIIDDPHTNPQRQVTSTPLCAFFIKSGDSDFLWLRGSMQIEREIGKDEFMGDVAEATGTGKKWEEAWRLKKSISKSSVWIPNTGQAALWNENQTTLEIKLDGYTLKVHPPKNIGNEEETALDRDYKKMAIGIAKAAGYIN
ncbi:hypothetical protein ABV409_02925 [Flagellimonas sp. DF-77]|uniref:hypothetical protein n=1 Tax=Flagellimonas algarum TaxID=3230298 RepID=UPI00339254C7